MLLREKVLRQIAGLSVRHGGASASEEKKRAMMGDKYGRAPGAKSIGRVERQLKKEGRLFRRRYYRGQRLPNGVWLTKGGRVWVYIITRQQQRAARRVAKKLAAAAAPSTPRETPRPHRPGPRAPRAPELAPATPDEVRGALTAAGLAWMLTGPPRPPST